MLQVAYISTAQEGADVDEILRTSQRNNATDGVTGLLFTDGVRFLQVLEGPNEKVEATFERILSDERHRAVVLLSNRTILDREFGDWAMARRSPGEDGHRLLAELSSHLVRATPSIRATFESFARLNRAA